MPSNELTRVSSLFNEEVYKEVSPFIIDFPWETEIAKLLCDTIKENGTELSDETIKSVVIDKLIPSEISPLLESIHKYREISSKEDVKIIANSLFEYYQTRKLQTALDVYSAGQSIKKLLTDVKEIPEEFTAEIQVKTLGELDPREVYERELGGAENVLPSTIKIIRDATPFNGYLPGQVVCVTAPPGVGKSAFIMQEIAAQAAAGYKVLMLILGDLMEYDVLTRFTSLVTGTKYYEVAVKPDKYFNDVREIANNIDIVVTPAKSITSQQILDLVKSSKKRYDVVVVDYDSNVKTSSDNMYDAGGELYDKLTAIARPNDQTYRLVFVACQPKIQYWDNEELPEEALGESSRKQHNIDMMITIGKANTSNGKRMGIIALPKVRRGNPGLKSAYMVTDFGQFEEIVDSIYKANKVYRG